MTLPLPFAVLVTCAAVQRAVELLWSRHNVARLADPRPSESRGAFSRMVAVHVALLVLPVVEVALRAAPTPRAAFVAGLALYLLAQGIRFWALASLGRAWNARAVVDPGLGFVSAGPYRWIRHPNYLAVLIEFVALPLAGGAWISLVLLNAIHAPILLRRVRGEEAALDRVPGYRHAMAGKGRFLPRRIVRETPRGRGLRT